MQGRRGFVAYLILLVACCAATIASLLAGAGRESQPDVAGIYKLADSSTFALRQSGQFVNALAPGACRGKLRLREGRLRGALACPGGRGGALDVRPTGAEERQALRGTLAGRPFRAVFVEKLPRLGQAPPRAAAEGEEHKEPTAEQVFGRLMLAIAAVILAARLFRVLVARIGQPPVMGEVLAGILLGPTLLGALLPSVKDYLFPDFVLPLLGAGASIGLAFYMFLVGLELDPRQLRGRVGQAAMISTTSIALPMALGVAVALPTFSLIAPDTTFVAFALFMGVAMSITAFPVLARILVERRMLKRPVGALTLSAAAVDDVTAWGLLALASAVAAQASALKVLPVIAYVAVFCAVMGLLVRPVLGRLSTAYEEAGQVPGGWLAAIFVGVLLSAYVSMKSGIAPIFGAFVMGLIMPRRAGLSHDVTRRLEDFVSVVLLPLFFVVTGLRTEIGLLDRPVLWLLTLAFIAVAVAGKWAGAMLAARFAGHRWRESGVIGALMNTRGLTELIVLNIGLDLGVISPALFTMLVIMALVTTFMTAPALRLLDPRGELSAPVEEEMREARQEVPPERPAPERSILVAPLEERNVDQLLALAVPLAQSRPERELILARLLEPSRGATMLGPADREVERASRELARIRDDLVARGIASRAVAFTSVDRGADLLRLASEQEVDLVLVDGRRPLLGGGVPGGAVGLLLEHAPCDVGVLVERERVPQIDADHAVLVPFGGEEHDWAALELGAWIASLYDAPLRLLGTAGDVARGARDASRLLADASLVVQQLAGVAAEPLLAPPGREGVIDAARDAGLLVVGLSERWRQEGLGPMRAEIARAAPTPTLFVRRGHRAGALAPRQDMTRFSWSRSG